MNIKNKLDEALVPEPGIVFYCMGENPTNDELMQINAARKHGLVFVFTAINRRVRHEPKKTH